MFQKKLGYRRSKCPLLLGWTALFLLSFAALSYAHDPGLSVATAHVESTGLGIDLSMSPVDVQKLVSIDTKQNGKISLEELAAAQPGLEKMALGAFEVRQEEQIIPAAKAIVRLDTTGAVRCEIFYPGLTGGKLSIRSVILGSLPRFHREYLSLYDHDSKLLCEEMLDVSHHTLTTVASKQVPATPVLHSFREFLWLGIVHIATGYDHILFLLGLLMVGGSFKSAFKIITSFTLAHSLTLALATMNLINIPSRIIEPLIAVSIIYVGVENMVSRAMDKRWMLAFGFGLVHGCGFATALRDLGIGSNGTGILLPLFSFNLGVEVAQMTMAVMILPSIWSLQENPQFVSRFVPIGSCAIALAGTWWLMERTLL